MEHTKHKPTIKSPCSRCGVVCELVPLGDTPSAFCIYCVNLVELYAGELAKRGGDFDSILRDISARFIRPPIAQDDTIAP